jgi:nucleoside-diphosphate-sugar epimerase
MKNVLITGGAGYIGTSLIPLLLNKDYNVTVIDNLMFGGDQLLPFLRDKNFKFIKGDVTNKSDVEKVVIGQDIIIHLAAIVGYPACRKNPELAEKVNVTGTRNIIESLIPTQLLIYSSTGSNYGSVDGICTEDTPLNPLSLYGQTKTMAEEMIHNRDNSIVFRFATAFGSAPRFRLDLLPNDFTHKMITQGYLIVYEKHFMRTFIHVHDIARSFVFAIENSEKMVNNVYNVGTDEMNYSKENVCDIIKSKTDGYVHYADVGEDADKRNYVVDYSKIKSLGYTTTINMEEGIDELVQAISLIEVTNKYQNI